MKVVVRIVNYIRSHGLTHRQFKEFFFSFEEEYPDIPYHAEVRWLSKGKVISRIFRLRHTVAQFLESKGRPEPLFHDPEWVADLGFLADIMAFLNDLSLKLQKENNLINDMISKINAFQYKLKLLKNNLSEKNTQHFPELASVQEGGRFEKYVEVLQSLENAFNDRFQEISYLQPILDVFVKPFSMDIESAPSDLHFKLIDLQSDVHQKDVFYNTKGLLQFYQNLSKEEFPKIAVSQSLVPDLSSIIANKIKSP
ncbi:general transcription factor II-I repeat domain-containing protein 2-like [Schistocerca piceifrons]|uniref:general transcription factor II-I repeat domain-containing protein 2-like n=1 Tax=Schistocerca piceifrons TaxID=274613 RepID=UPI001F5E4364|nr:general transcription factor II-I repeat domain-containing protein 2-like [Schistocerca piceifrons]